MVLRCAVVGLTSIGSRHALGMVGDSRVKLVAGCDDGYADNDGKSAAQVGGAFEANYAAVYPELNIYSSHKEMLAKEPQLDIVTVGVSDHRHADIVVDAANAGVKGIFCEKPLATTLEDTDRMLAACEQNGVILSVDHTRRFLPIWRYCKEQLVDKGAIGEIQYIIARLHGMENTCAASPTEKCVLLQHSTLCFAADDVAHGCGRTTIYALAKWHPYNRLHALVCWSEAKVGDGRFRGRIRGLRPLRPTRNGRRERSGIGTGCQRLHFL
eukprot:SAG31_NODE_41_length_31342_cov_8.029286_1_plen_269_part_00